MDVILHLQCFDYEPDSVLIDIFSSHFVVFLAEQRQRLAADERRREYHEEQRNKYENYAEEENDGESVRLKSLT